MSLVTNVLLKCLWEQPCVDKINEWLEEHEKGKLAKVDGYAGGRKFMELDLYAGAFNYLDVIAFIDVVDGQPWDDREHVQLFIQEQKDDFLVDRFGR